MKKIKFLSVALFLFSSLSVWSQQMASNNTLVAMTETNSNAVSITNLNTNWSVFIDDAKTTLFVDFEFFGKTVYELVVTDKNNKTIYSEFTFDLPANTIYEYSIKALTKGTYTLHVHTKSGEFVQDFNID
jgi:hypothetical protein